MMGIAPAAMILGLLLVFPLTVSGADVLDRALDEGLLHAMELKDEGYRSPYFVSLTVTDIEQSDWSCTMGSLRFKSRSASRIVSPDIRVGDYTFDNHPASPSSVLLGRSFSLGDDAFSLRHGIWRLLDNAYKHASASFLRKKARRVRRGKAEYDTDDLTREPGRRPAAAPAPAVWPLERIKELCVESSRVFRERPELLHAETSVTFRTEEWRVRDTEGGRADFRRDFVHIEMGAVDITEDGMRVPSSRSFLATTPEGIPSADELRSQARSMMEDIAALKASQSTATFSAPAILDESIAAAIVLAVGSRLSGEAQRNPGGAQIFKGKLGDRVWPGFLNLVDDPTLAYYEGRPLAGHYLVDDQGIPASRVSLVHRGVLKGFLLSRYPVIGFSRSNGHGRNPPGYRAKGAPGNLILTSSRKASEGKLLRILRKECRKRGKPFGLWVRKLRSYVQQKSTGGQGSIRIQPGLLYLVEAKTGKLTLVRDLDVVGAPLVLMSHILRTGDKPRVSNLLTRVPVAVVTPSLLVAEIELQRTGGRPRKPPLQPGPRP